MRRGLRGGSFSGRRGGRPLRGMDWGGGRGSADLGPSTASRAWVLRPSDVQQLYTDPTLIRSILAFQFRLTVSPATSSWTAIGVIAVTGDPSNTATVPNANAEYPHPLDDPQADWILRVPVPWASGTTVGSTASSLGAGDSWVNSRAMRRLGSDTGLMVIMESVAITGTWIYEYRYLIKE